MHKGWIYFLSIETFLYIFGCYQHTVRFKCKITKAAALFLFADTVFLKYNYISLLFWVGLTHDEVKTGVEGLTSSLYKCSWKGPLASLCLNSFMGGCQDQISIYTDYNIVQPTRLPLPLPSPCYVGYLPAWQILDLHICVYNTYLKGRSNGVCDWGAYKLMTMAISAAFQRQLF